MTGREADIVQPMFTQAEVEKMIDEDADTIAACHAEIKRLSQENEGLRTRNEQLERLLGKVDAAYSGKQLLTERLGGVAFRSDLADEIRAALPLSEEGMKP
jgi:cell shape-determining protein MreC